MIEVIRSRRKYFSAVGENVEKSEDYFSGRTVKYEVEDDEGNIEEKEIFINKEDLEASITLEELIDYLEGVENS